MLEEQLLLDIRQYILAKTGILYFSNIKTTSKDIMVSCPYHKGGQEHKPSCGIKRVGDDKGTIGTMHCFTCGVTTNLLKAVQDLLGNLYDEDSVENRFHLKEIIEDAEFEQENQIKPIFLIPTQETYVKDNILRAYRTYHPYLAQRKITLETADVYDIGYDPVNKHITFPLRNSNMQCIGIGRRSIEQKQYIYPQGLIKPLYGIELLNEYVRYVWVVEGPFNLWSLYQYNKSGVALLGTGTETQYKALVKVKCDGYVLALDGDDAGRKGILKLGTFLEQNYKKVFVAWVPDNQDINDMTEQQFRTMLVTPFSVWKRRYDNH